MIITFGDENMKNLYDDVTDATHAEKKYEIIYGFEVLYNFKNQIDILKATDYFCDYLKTGWTRVVPSSMKNVYNIFLYEDEWLVVSIHQGDSSQEDTICMEGITTNV